MSLIDRESIIAQRRDEILSRERAAQLAGMVAAQQGRSSKPAASSSKKTKKSSKSKSSKPRRARAESDMDEDTEDEDDEDDDDEEVDSDDGEGLAANRSSRVRKSVGTSDARSQKLKELTQNRKKKAARSSRKTRDEDSRSKAAKRTSSSSGEESEESEGYVDTDEELEKKRGLKKMGGRRREEGPFVSPEAHDINKARIGREDILKIMYRKGWENRLVGNFVRVVADAKRDERTGKMVQRYRAYEIVDWKHGSKWYEVDTGKWTKVLLVLSFAKEKHTKEIMYVSNSRITDEEFQRYEWQAKEAPRRPSRGQVLEQAEEWEEYVNEPWTEEVFTEVLKARKQAKAEAEAAGADKAGFHRNGGIGSSRDQGRPTAATYLSSANGSGSSTPSIPQPGEPKTEDVLLAELNERNRKADRERIQEAERKQAEIRRAATMAAAQAAAAASQSASSEFNHQEEKAAKKNRLQAPSTFIAKPTEVEIDLGDF